LKTFGLSPFVARGARSNDEETISYGKARCFWPKNIEWKGRAKLSKPDAITVLQAIKDWQSLQAIVASKCALFPFVLLLGNLTRFARLEEVGVPLRASDDAQAESAHHELVKSWWPDKDTFAERHWLPRDVLEEIVQRLNSSTLSAAQSDAAAGPRAATALAASSAAATMTTTADTSATASAALTADAGSLATTTSASLAVLAEAAGLAASAAATTTTTAAAAIAPFL
jgi:hypothetical protein